MTVVNTVKWKQQSLLTLLTMIFVAILVGITLIVHRFPGRLDLTEGKQYSLSGQSQKMVKGLKKDVWIRAFFQEGNPGKKKAEALFEAYATFNPRIHFQFIDPDRQPSLTQQYGVRHYGALLLESGGKTQAVASADEAGITNGLLRLFQEKVKKVVFLTGHGEKSPRDAQKGGYSLARGILEKENYQVEEMSLLTGNGLPEGTACLVIAGPKKPFFPAEVEALKKYISAGGRLILMLEPYQDGGLKEWLAAMGLILNNDMVIDKVSRVFGGDYLIPMAGSYGRHPITDNFTVATFYPTARSIGLSPSPVSGVRVDVLVRSSNQSWAETNKAKLEKGEASYEAGQDQKGPLNLAVLIHFSVKEQKGSHKDPGAKEDKTSRGRVALFGDSDFADNNYFNLSGNGDLFLNTVNYLTEEEALIAIRPAKSAVRPLSLSPAQASALFVIPMILLPFLVIGAGIFVWRSRRKAR